MSAQVGQQIGQYRIDALLGEGGMGAVYRAFDLNLQREVALKLTHAHLARQQTFRERFMQEARAAARLKHPSIVDIYQFGTEGDMLFMVMEFVRGASLGKYVRQLQQSGQVVELRETLEVLAQVADALGYAHRQGVVHRDIKPDNVLLERLDEAPEPGGVPLRAKVTDFGLAKMLEGGVETKTGTFMGTLPYMSPEQCLGNELDGRSDLYSLGVMLYQLSTGRLPFDIRTPTDAVMKHLEQVPPRPSTVNPGLPAKVEAIITKALAKKPEDRFPNGTVMARAIRIAASELTPNDVTTFAAPGTVLSILTRLELDEPAPRPSSMGTHLTALPDEAQLLIAQQGKPPRTYPLDKDQYTIGRATENDIILNVDGISRRHARIERGPEGWQVVDLNSTNGTFIEETKLLGGIPEPWPEGRMLRVGPYFMRWRGAALPDAFTTTPDARSMAAPPPRDSGRPGVVPLPEQRTVLPGGTQIRSMSGQLAVTIKPSSLELEAGGRATVQVELFNQGSAVNHYRLQIDGLPAEWLTVPQDSLQLMPGSQGVLSFTIHPPRAAATRAGTHPFTVTVVPSANTSDAATVAAQLQIAPFHSFAADMRPSRIKHGASSRVVIRNDGNAPANYRLVGRDPADALQFTTAGVTVQVAPGERQATDVEVRAGKRPWFGREEQFPFTMQVIPSSGDAQTLPGTMSLRPRLPGWLIPLLGLLFTFICLAGSAAFYLVNQNNQNAAATATAEALALLDAANNADVDGDGLSQLEEEALGTDPNNADTDGDGLNDGAEGPFGTDPLNPDSDGDGLPDGQERAFGTDPAVIDSDGDTLTDGEEVANGTSPINPDTDDDGLNDNVDPDPGQQPTFTPTPPPTATPTGTLAPTNTPTPTGTPPPTNTPTLTPTPTNTPPPPLVNPLVAYVDNGNLFLMTLAGQGDLLEVESLVQLTGDNNVEAVAISPDGSRVAIVSIFIGGGKEIAVIDIESGNRTSLVAPADLYVAPEFDSNPDALLRVVDTIRWSPDGRRIIFNTFVSGVAFGAPMADLWTVDLDGNIRQVFSQYEAGALGIFDDGRVLVGGSTEIFLTDLDGSFRTTLLSYDQILTYSEYIYYPQPQIGTRGDVAFVSVPTSDPLADDAAIDLYVIEAGGGVTALRRLVGSGFTLADEVVWSPGGNQIAYVRTSPDENSTALFIGDESGSFVQYGVNGGILDFLAWSPDESTFLYADLEQAGRSGEPSLVVGVLSARPLSLYPELGVVLDAAFLTDSQYLMAVKEEPYALYVGNLGGDVAPLVTVTTDGTVLFDVYLP